jgi:hypothetical protein
MEKVYRLMIDSEQNGITFIKDHILIWRIC